MYLELQKRQKQYAISTIHMQLGYYYYYARMIDRASAYAVYTNRWCRANRDLRAETVLLQQFNTKDKQLKRRKWCS